mgnify:CR=1 FL=1
MCILKKKLRMNFITLVPGPDFFNAGSGPGWFSVSGPVYFQGSDPVCLECRFFSRAGSGSGSNPAWFAPWHTTKESPMKQNSLNYFIVPSFFFTYFFQKLVNFLSAECPYFILTIDKVGLSIYKQKARFINVQTKQNLLH